MPVTGLTAPFKVSLFFHQIDGATGNGWSENYHWNATSYDTVKAGLATFVPDRLKLCVDNVVFDAARVSYPGQKHQDLVLNASGLAMTSSLGTYVAAAGTAGDTCQSDVALLLRVRDVANFHTSVWLHGVPEDVPTGNEYNPTTAFVTAMTAFQSDLFTYCMVKQPGANLYSPMTTVDSIRVANRKVGRPFGAVRGRR